MDETTGTAGTTDPAARHAALVAAIEEANRRYYVEDAPTLGQLRHAGMLVELVEVEQQTRQEREERALDQVQANKELIRNLAHEIKNPLGGIRGAAQLLQSELTSPQQTEYTQVIIGEADRRIAEDRLRAIRFFRFHAQLDGWSIDPAGLAAAIRARSASDNGSSGTRRTE